MGIVTTTIIVTNAIDVILMQRGFIPEKQIRYITLENVLVDTGATNLCLPADIILELGLPFEKQIQIKTVTGITNARLFKCARLTVEGREDELICTELPGGEDALLGVTPLEKLKLQPDIINQRLILLPKNGKDTQNLML
jgi:predicted aspartyl protease